MRAHRIALLAALAILAAGQALQAAEALTLENIVLKDYGAQSGVISPDGLWLAVAARSAEQRGIFLVSTPANPERRSEFWVEGSSPVWAPDSRRILFFSDGDIHTVGLGSREAAAVTDDDHSKRDAVFSPDGSTIAYYSTASGSQDIWLVPAGGGEPRQLTRDSLPADDNRYQPAFSPDGRRIVYVSSKASYWHDDVWLADVASGSEKQLSRSLMSLSTPAWSPDGSSIAVLATRKDEFWHLDLADIYLLNPASGAETKIEMPIHASDSLMRHAVHWSGDGRFLYFLFNEHGDSNVWSVPSAGGVATRLTNLQGPIGSLDASRGAGALALVRSTPTRGSEVEYLDTGGGPLQRVTRFSQTWEGVRAPEEIYFRSFDGLYMQGFLYLPPDLRSDGSYPALVQVHGGGTNSYMRGPTLLEQYLASRGFVVLAINYRGGSNFGRAFQSLGINDWASGQARDAGAAADFLRSLPYTSGKVGIYGYSYGGIMSMAAITRVPDKFDAAVPMAGIYDFADAYETADRVGKIFTKTGHSGSPEEKPEHYAVSNSLARVENINLPLLIMHGEEDVRAPFRQYQLAVELLRKHGKDFQSKSYPGEPHGFRNPRNRIDMYERLEAFFVRHLK